MLVRPVEDRDIEAVTDLYAHHVRDGLGTFEEVAPASADMAERIAAVRAVDLPYLVAEADRRIVGFAYASAFRPRSGYRYSAEDSVYVAPDRAGRGVGRALLTAVISACEAKGLRQLTAYIGDSANQASVGLHRSCGFEVAGVLRGLGFKHRRWVDVVVMQRALNGGAEAPPDGSGWFT